MWKNLTNVLPILIVILFTPLFVALGHTDETIKLEGLSEAIQDMNTKIENLRISFGKLETKFDLLKQENLKASTAQQKKLEEKLKETDARLNLAKQFLDLSESNLSLPRMLLIFLATGGAFLTLFVLIGGYVLRRETRGRVKSLKKEFNRKFEEEKKNLDNQKKEIDDLRILNHWALGLVYDEKGVSIYKIRIEDAIRFGETAVENYIMGRASQPKELADRTIASAKTNLAYYYAFAGEPDKRSIALDYVDTGLPIFRRRDDMDKIDCFLFVYRKFATDIEDRRKWLSVYEIYRERIQAHQGIDQEIRIDYEDYYKYLLNIVGK